MQQCCFDRRVLVCKTSVFLFVRPCALETVQIDNAVSNFFDWLLRVQFDANLSSRCSFEKKDIRSLPNFFNQKGIKSFATLLAAAIKLLLPCSLMPDVQKNKQSHNNKNISLIFITPNMTGQCSFFLVRIGDKDTGRDWLPYSYLEPHKCRAGLARLPFCANLVSST